MVGWSKLNVHQRTYDKIEELKEEWHLGSQNAVIEKLLEVAGVNHDDI